jgi:DNA-binding CsgD family transcriptional regulator
VRTLLEREREVAAVQQFVEGGSGVLLIEGRAGIGKTALLEVATRRAHDLQRDILSARGSELEAGFAFGVVRQLFERRLASAGVDEREALLAGSALAGRRLLLGQVGEATASDTSFAVLHGLYWLAANLAARRPLLIAVDDAHWADEPSLRWLAYLAPRLEGLGLALLVALRPGRPALMASPLLALRGEAETVLRPALLSEGAVAAVVRALAGSAASDQLCTALYRASGGNPLYLTELLRAIDLHARPLAELDPGEVLAGGLEGIARRVVARVRGLEPHALGLAQALAILGDGCELRHAARVAGVEMAEAARLAEGLVRLEVLAADASPRFIHPVVRAALEASLDSHERDAAHHSAARVLHADGAPAGQVAAHLVGVRPSGDGWVLARLEEAAQAALESGAPQAAARLLGRALAEPPPAAARVRVLRAAARAEASAGRATACGRLEEALRLTADPRERAEIALEVAEVYAALFRWVDAVEVIERALADLGDADVALAARLEGELVVAGLHDARGAARVGPVLARLAAHQQAAPGEALAVAQGMARFLAGRPVDEIAVPLEQSLARAGSQVDNWDTRAALLWVLVASERFASVEDALTPLLAEAQRSGSARGFVAAYSTLGLLELRLGALPEADAAARVALRVLQEGDFAPGLGFAATVLADIAVEAGEYAEAQALLDLLPPAGWPAGVGTVLIPAARGRLRLAQGRAAEALADFETCLTLFGADVWGMPIRETGYVHARSGAALALLRLDQRQRACELADAELADVRVFGAPCALGVALRVAGLVRGGEEGLELLRGSATALRGSLALLERAHSLAELGAALRRAGHRAEARDPLGEALELAARCGARPLAARVRDELKAIGARPRRAWRTGVDALTPSELRVVRLAAEGASNREIAHELYVTLKTVEGHLARAYAKLGVEGRGELAPLVRAENTRVATL